MPGNDLEFEIRARVVFAIHIGSRRISEIMKTAGLSYWIAYGALRDLVASKLVIRERKAPESGGRYYEYFLP